MVNFLKYLSSDQDLSSKDEVGLQCEADDQTTVDRRILDYRASKNLPKAQILLF